MKLPDLIIKIEKDIAKGKNVLKTDNKDYVGVEIFYEFRTSSLSSLLMIYGKEHPYYKDFDKQCDTSFTNRVLKGLGILNAVLDELKGGWLITTKGLITAEVFADFLEMAFYLLSENYKDPAAVIAGSVLEEHLRQLCLKADIEINFIDKSGESRSKKANQLNSDLTNSKIYDKDTLDNKNVTAWLDLRNKAAHGKYSEYSKELVELMLSGIRDFITRNAI